MRAESTDLAKPLLRSAKASSTVMNVAHSAVRLLVMLAMHCVGVANSVMVANEIPADTRFALTCGILRTRKNVAYAR